MADSTTTNYGFAKPEVGASTDTWGSKLNANWDTVDTQLKAVSDVADSAASTATDAKNLATDALPKAGGQMTGSVTLDADNAYDIGTATVAHRNIFINNLRIGDFLIKLNGAGNKLEFRLNSTNTLLASLSDAGVWVTAG